MIILFMLCIITIAIFIVEKFLSFPISINFLKMWAVHRVVISICHGCLSFMTFNVCFTESHCNPTGCSTFQTALMMAEEK